MTVCFTETPNDGLNQPVHYAYERHDSNLNRGQWLGSIHQFLCQRGL